jgi:pilus assembly protein CpaF
MVDARLPDGSRVNVIIPPLALDGPMMSIRRFAADPFTAADLVEFGTLTPALVELVKAVVGARLNVLISGGTGAGKTLVNAAVEWARAGNRRLMPLCPFARSVFEKTPDYRDVLD